ncbi:WYL domain-containing protein [Streptomyces sp. NPDC093261]|uniref:WYL domain-containing protein n=1 Tax=Streptomyces sp. NPDC093261 TaxID=3366037 RepID=UPI0038181F06
MDARLTRRTFTRIALSLAPVLVSAVRGKRFVMLVDLLRASDLGRVVEIAYTKADGESSVRLIEVHELRPTEAGEIVVRAFDRLRAEDRTFRIDRIAAYRLAA